MRNIDIIENNYCFHFIIKFYHKYLSQILFKVSQSSQPSRGSLGRTSGRSKSGDSSKKIWRPRQKRACLDSCRKWTGFCRNFVGICGENNVEIRRENYVEIHKDLKKILELLRIKNIPFTNSIV